MQNARWIIIIYYGNGGRCTTAPPPLNKLPWNYHIMVVYMLILVEVLALIVASEYSLSISTFSSLLRVWILGQKVGHRKEDKRSILSSLQHLQNLGRSWATKIERSFFNFITIVSLSLERVPWLVWFTETPYSMVLSSSSRLWHLECLLMTSTKNAVLYSPLRASQSTSTSRIFSTSTTMKVKPTLFEPPSSPLFNGRGIEAF